MDFDRQVQQAIYQSLQSQSQRAPPPRHSSSRPAASASRPSPIRSTLAREGILPVGQRVERKTVSSAGAASPSAARGKPRTGAQAAKPAGKEAKAILPAGWVRLGSGSGRAKYSDKSPGELILTATTAQFALMHPQSSLSDAMAGDEFSVTLEAKCVGHLCVLLGVRGGSQDRKESKAENSTSTFLKVEMNSATKSWHVKQFTVGASADAQIGVASDKALVATSWSRIELRVHGQGTLLDLTVDKHAFFKGLSLTAVGRVVGPLGFALTQSKATVRAVRLVSKSGSVTVPTGGLGRSTSPPASAPAASGASARAEISDRTVRSFFGASAVGDGAGAGAGGSRGSVSAGSAASAGAASADSKSAASAASSSESKAVKPDSKLPSSRSPYTLAADDEKELVSMIEQTVIDRDLKVSFDQIASLADAKRILKEAIVMPLLLPQLFSGLTQPSRGVLLHGPPGTGKTMLARAVASASETVFFNVSPSTLVSKWRGDSEKLLRTLFRMARHYSPSIIFFDEVEALVDARSSGEHEASKRFKSVLFSELDGINSTATQARVLVLATTNRPWDLDAAIRRRLEKRVYVPMPDTEARKQMFAIHLASVQLDSSVSLATLASRTEGYSGADILVVCREAAMQPVRRLVAGLSPEEMKALGAGSAAGGDSSASQLRPQALSAADFDAALSKVSPSVNSKELGQFEAWQKEFGSL